MRSPTLDANVQFMQEASQMKNSKHMKLKTFFDPCQTYLLHILLNLSPLSTLCTLQSITFKKIIFYIMTLFMDFKLIVFWGRYWQKKVFPNSKQIANWWLPTTSALSHCALKSLQSLNTFRLWKTFKLLKTFLDLIEDPYTNEDPKLL